MPRKLTAPHPPNPLNALAGSQRDPFTRREFLMLCASSLPAFAAKDAMAIGTPPPPPVQVHSPSGIQRFIDALPRPAVIRPQDVRGGIDRYRIRMVQFERRLHSELPPARLWGYEGSHPGPIIEARSGRTVEVEWRNDLPQQHLFRIDRSLHAAAAPTSAVRTVPHLHGAQTDSRSDGLPENWFTPGHSVVYRYPNRQHAAPLWYHDHAGGISRLNLYAGLSGFYFLRDLQELSLHLPTGDYEVPLIFEDRIVDGRGQLLYAPTQDSGSIVPPGKWGPQFFGDLPLVNGTIYPYLEVEPRRYRFRMLNAANSRFFNFYLNTAKNPTDIPSLVSFDQIGSDGGLLAAPVALKHLLLGPAERADLIVDFSKLAGKTVTLSNNADSPYPNWGGRIDLYPSLRELMQFRVTLPLRPASSTWLPPAPIRIQRLDPARSVRTRDFILSERMDSAGNSLEMLMNGKPYDAPATVFPQLGTVETWRFINTTDDAHPMHLHLVQFQILARQGFNNSAFALDGSIQLIGRPRPPDPGEAGWKDTAVVNPGEVLILLVPFRGFAGKFVFHCHLSEHADNDMMRPFVVVQPKD